MKNLHLGMESIYDSIFIIMGCYKLVKTFKSRPSSEYPNNLLKTPYQYVVFMLCRLYGKPDASKFLITWVPLIYYVVDVGSTFNWVNILSTSLEEALRIAKERWFASVTHIDRWVGLGSLVIPQSIYTTRCFGNTSIR